MISKGHTMKLGDVITLLSGNTPSKSEEEYWGGEFPWASAKDMKQFFISQTKDKLTPLGVEKSSKVVPAYTSLILTRGMTLVKDVPICVVNQKSSFNQDLKAVVPKDGAIETDFVPYLLLGNKAKIHSLVDLAGHGTGRLPTGSLLDLEVYIPEQQDRLMVIRLFQGLDKKIQLNRQTNQTLEHIAQALFKSWFVDFEPIRAKIEAMQAGQDPERAAMAAISGMTVAELDQLDAAQLAQLKTTAALFPDGLLESELGEVPEGWDLKNVGDIVKRLKPKKRYTKKQVEAFGKTPVYEQGASILLGYHNDDAGFEATPEAPIFIFGDHTCVLHLSCEEFDISQNVIPLTGDEYPTIWVYYAVLGKQAFQEYRRHWSEFVIKDVMVCCPMLAEEFARRVTVLYEYKEQYVRESKALEQLRDTLLPKLLSGELSPTQTEVA